MCVWDTQFPFAKSQSCAINRQPFDRLTRCEQEYDKERHAVNISEYIYFTVVLVYSNSS